MWIYSFYSMFYGGYILMLDLSVVQVKWYCVSMKRSSLANFLTVLIFREQVEYTWMWLCNWCEWNRRINKPYSMQFQWRRHIFSIISLYVSLLSCKRIYTGDRSQKYTQINPQIFSTFYCFENILLPYYIIGDTFYSFIDSFAFY